MSPLEEQYGNRDGELLYSRWHRPASMRRFVGVDVADAMSMINIDHIYRCDRWASYCGHCRRTQLIVESALDFGQSDKVARVTARLASDLRIPAVALVALITPTADGQDIERFRVKQVAPLGAIHERLRGWQEFSPQKYVDLLVWFRRHSKRCNGCPVLAEEAA